LLAWHQDMNDLTLAPNYVIDIAALWSPRGRAVGLVSWLMKTGIPCGTFAADRESFSVKKYLIDNYRGFCNNAGIPSTWHAHNYSPITVEAT
jgi:hypothetical protein